MKTVTWEGTIDKEGFAVIPHLFAREDMDQLFKDINQAGPKRSRAGVRHALGLNAVAAVAQQPHLIELVRTVLGSAAFPFRATLFDKSPDSNWLVVWHQDTALPLRSRRDVLGWGPWSMKEGLHYAHAPSSTLSEILALRIPLDDSTATNGPLRVLPGTHKLGVLNNDAIHELAGRIAPVDGLVPKGGIVAMRPLLVHASSKTQTRATRKVLHIEYAAAASVAKPLDLALA
jgi:ectoine hydroxylase-related dioxygenase (phytanoyl-CoA dioxygenase family)